MLALTQEAICTATMGVRLFVCVYFLFFIWMRGEGLTLILTLVKNKQKQLCPLVVVCLNYSVCLCVRIVTGHVSAIFNNIGCRPSFVEIVCYILCTINICCMSEF